LNLIKRIFLYNKTVLVLDVLIALGFILLEYKVYGEFTTVGKFFAFFGSIFLLILLLTCLVDYLAIKHEQTMIDSEDDK
jgi:hypothetical protein